jgi:DNA-binding FadR family transcriptional regulator
MSENQTLEVPIWRSLRRYEKMAENPPLSRLPSQLEITREFGVSRGVAIRAFANLQREGLVEAVPCSRWRILRSGRAIRSLPLVDQIDAVFTEDKLSPALLFPVPRRSVSASASRGLPCGGHWTSWRRAGAVE